MNALELLESQHRDVEELFAQIEAAPENDAKTHAFEALADSLAIHAAIEEHQFYPAVNANGAKEIVLESAEEHLAIKRVVADLLDIDADDQTFEAKVKLLKQLVLSHVKEEETQLFPKVKELLASEQLEELGEEMESEAGQLYSDGAPRMNIPDETQHAAPV